ncbi:hypothetical protein QBC38DRAFT_457601 [Podospora fimiseda]|uniref:AA1-like domain-containing protein n=1 Tax=Podospora fimiseda TaxID=252190 RepID=A0AAN7BKU4_9PEZI|nr:hypothetical protein QBC38DRAFT_457601 [Podospora fimiseda]
MKFATLLTTTTTLLTSALAAPLEPRVVAKSFSVSEFSAGCLPHGTLANIGFKVATNEQPFSTTCSFSGQPLGTSSLPDVPFTACADPSIAWSFRRVTADPFGLAPFYELTLVTAEQSLAAAKFFPGSEFPLINAGSSYYQQYNGTTLFVVQ